MLRHCGPRVQTVLGAPWSYTCSGTCKRAGVHVQACSISEQKQVDTIQPPCRWDRKLALAALGIFSMAWAGAFALDLDFACAALFVWTVVTGVFAVWAGNDRDAWRTAAIRAGVSPRTHRNQTWRAMRENAAAGHGYGAQQGALLPEDPRMQPGLAYANVTDLAAQVAELSVDMSRLQRNMLAMNCCIFCLTVGIPIVRLVSWIIN